MEAYCEVLRLYRSREPLFSSMARNRAETLMEAYVVDRVCSGHIPQKWGALLGRRVGNHYWAKQAVGAAELAYACAAAEGDTVAQFAHWRTRIVLGAARHDITEMCAFLKKKNAAAAAACEAYANLYAKYNSEIGKVKTFLERQLAGNDIGAWLLHVFHHEGVAHERVYRELTDVNGAIQNGNHLLVFRHIISLLTQPNFQADQKGLYIYNCLLLAGVGIKTDKATAVKSLRTLAKNGYQPAKIKMAEIMSDPDSTFYDINAAIAIYDALAKEENSKAYTGLANLAEKGLIPMEENTIFRLRSAAEMGRIATQQRKSYIEKFIRIVASAKEENSEAYNDLANLAEKGPIPMEENTAFRLRSTAEMDRMATQQKKPYIEKFIRIIASMMLLICVIALSACGPAAESEQEDETLPASTATAPPSEEIVSKAIVPAEAIKMLIDDWVGWKPLLDANGGWTTDADSIYGNTFEIVVDIDCEPAETLTVEALSAALINDGYNAVGCFVNQYAELSQLLEAAGVSARAIYVPAMSSGWDYILSNDESTIFTEDISPVIAAKRDSNALFLALSYFYQVRGDVFNDVHASLRLFDTHEEAIADFMQGNANWIALDQSVPSPPNGTPAYSTRESREAVVGVIVVTESVWNGGNGIANHLVRGAIKSLTEHADDYQFIRLMPQYAELSDEQLAELVQSVAFADEIDNRDVLFAKDYARNAFNNAVRFRALFAGRPTPATNGWRDDATYYLGAIPPSDQKRERLPTDVRSAPDVIRYADVQFAADSVEFENMADAQQALAGIITELKVLTGYDISVYGYASLRLGEELSTFGADLAMRRADRIKAYFVTEGIDASRITAVGAGGLSSTHSEADSQNRKVLIEYRMSR